MVDKTQFDVETDVNIKVGKVNTAGLIPGIKKAIASKLAGVKPIKPNLSLDLSRLRLATVGLAARIRDTIKNITGSIKPFKAGIQVDLSRIKIDTSKLLPAIREKVQSTLGRLKAASLPIKLDITKLTLDTKKFNALLENKLSAITSVARTLILPLKIKVNKINVNVRTLKAAIAKKLTGLLDSARALDLAVKVKISKIKITAKGLAKTVAAKLKDLSLETLTITPPVILSLEKVRISTKGLRKRVREKIKTLFKSGETIPLAVNLSLNADNITKRVKETSKAVKDLSIVTDEQSKANERSKKTADSSAKSMGGLGKEAKSTGKNVKGLTDKLGFLERELGISLKVLLRYTVIFQIFRTAVGTIGALVKNIVDLQDALVSIQAIGKLTADEITSVSEAIKDVATETKFTTTEIAQATQVLVQAGVSIDKISSTIRGVAEFASATNSTLQVSADIISTFQNVFDNLTVSDIADKLTNAVNISKLTPTGIQTIVSRLLQITKAYNIAADQVLGAIATLKNVGIKDSTVATGLRESILELLSPDSKTLAVLVKRYEAIGQRLTEASVKDLFTGFKDTANPLVAVINELEKLGIQGSGASDFERIFSVRSQNVISALIANKQQFEANTEAIKRTGSAAQGATKQLDSAKNAFSNLGAVLSAKAADAFTPFVDGAAEAANSVTSLLKTMRDAANSPIPASFSEAFSNLFDGNFRENLPKFLTGISNLASQRINNSPIGSLTDQLLGGTSGADQAQQRVKVLQDRATNIQGQISQADKKVTQAKSALDASTQFSDNANKALNDALTVQSEIAGVLSGGSGDVKEAQNLVDDAIKASKDVGSESFKNFITNITAALGLEKDALNPSDFASILQSAQDSISKAEAIRSELARKIETALASTDPTDAEANQVVKSFNALNGETRKLLLTSITGLDDAAQFLQNIPSVSASNASLVTALEEATKGQLDAQEAFFKNVLQQGLTGDPAAINRLRGLLLKQAAEGQSFFVEKYFGQLAALFSKENLDNILTSAVSNADATFKDSIAKFKKQVEASLTTSAAPAPTLPFSQALEVSRQNAQQDKANSAQRQVKIEELQTDLKSLQAQAFALISQAGTQLKSFDNTAQGLQDKQKFITDIGKQQKVLQDSIAKTQQQIGAEAAKTLTFQESLDQAQRATILSNEQIAQAEAKLKNLKDSSIKDSEAERGLVLKIATLKKNQLVAEQGILKSELDRLAKLEGFGDTSKVSLDNLLKAFDDPANKNIATFSKEFADVLQQAIENRRSLNNVEESLSSKLSSISKATLDAKISSASNQLATATADSKKLESDLNAATSRLSQARNKLSSELEKRANLKSFFQDITQSISGKGVTKSSIQDTLDQARQANSLQQQIQLSKKAATQAQQLQSSGRLSRGSAKSIIEDAQKLAIQAQDRVVAEQKIVVETLQRQRDSLQRQHDQSLKSRSELKLSLDALKASLDNLKLQADAAAKKALTQLQAQAKVQQPQPQQQQQVAGLETFLKTGNVTTAPPVVNVQPPPDASKAIEALANATGGTPVNFNFDGSSINTKADPKDISGFKRSLALQAIKSGKRFN